MTFIEHAKEEFLRSGYKPIEDCEADPEKWMQENVMELLEVFSKQGHSGTSAPHCIRIFSKLANYGLLSPLTKESMTFSDNQCCQKSDIFKDDKGCYYLNAIIFKGQNGSCFSGSVKTQSGGSISSRQYINFPFVPKTFYIDVIETEWSDRNETVKKDGGGWWTSIIKDETQLKEVFEYYKSL